jgi:hypothetical protein
MAGVPFFKNSNIRYKGSSCRALEVIAKAIALVSLDRSANGD